MNEEMRQRDLTRQAQRYLLWWLPILAIVIVQLSISLGWLPFSRLVFNGTWSLALLVMGAACLRNALQCNRVHCWFTGPYMLLMSLAMLLSLLRLLPGDPSPGTLANVAGGGSLLLWLVPEIFLGRYFGSRNIAD